MNDNTDPAAGAEQHQISEEVLIAALDTLKAGFILVDEQGRPCIGLDRSLGTLADGLLQEVTEIAEKYAHRCDLDKIPARSLWRQRPLEDSAPLE